MGLVCWAAYVTQVGMERRPSERMLATVQADSKRQCRKTKRTAGILAGLERTGRKLPGMHVAVHLPVVCCLRRLTPVITYE